MLGRAAKILRTAYENHTKNYASREKWHFSLKNEVCIFSTYSFFFLPKLTFLMHISVLTLFRHIFKTFDAFLYLNTFSRGAELLTISSIESPRNSLMSNFIRHFKMEKNYYLLIGRSLQKIEVFDFWYPHFRVG